VRTHNTSYLAFEIPGGRQHRFFRRHDRQPHQIVVEATCVGERKREHREREREQTDRENIEREQRERENRENTEREQRAQTSREISTLDSVESR